MFVRVMFDYSSTGLWEQSGASMEPEDLPVSQELHARIQDWVRNYDRDAWEHMNVSESEYHQVQQGAEKSTRLKDLEIMCEGHFKTSIVLAIDIKRELPNWTVIIYNEHPDLLDLPTDNRNNSEITALFAQVPERSKPRR